MYTSENIMIELHFELASFFTLKILRYKFSTMYILVILRRSPSPQFIKLLFIKLLTHFKSSSHGQNVGKITDDNLNVQFNQWQFISILFVRWSLSIGDVHWWEVYVWYSLYIMISHNDNIMAWRRTGSDNHVRWRIYAAWGVCELMT